MGCKVADVSRNGRDGQDGRERQDGTENTKDTEDTEDTELAGRSVGHRFSGAVVPRSLPLRMLF